MKAAEMVSTGTNLHLGANDGVVACQLSAVDVVHGCLSGGSALSPVLQEQRLNVGAVLIGQRLLVLVRPLADPGLPALSCVLVQRAGIHCRILHHMEE